MFQQFPCRSNLTDSSAVDRPSHNCLCLQVAFTKNKKPKLALEIYFAKKQNAQIRTGIDLSTQNELLTNPSKENALNL